MESPTKTEDAVKEKDSTCACAQATLLDVLLMTIAILSVGCSMFLNYRLNLHENTNNFFELLAGVALIFIGLAMKYILIVIGRVVSIFFSLVGLYWLLWSSYRWFNDKMQVPDYIYQGYAGLGIFLIFFGILLYQRFKCLKTHKENHFRTASFLASTSLSPKREKRSARPSVVPSSDFEKKILMFWSNTASTFATSKFVSFYMLPLLSMLLLIDSSQNGLTHVAVGALAFQLYLYFVIGLGNIFARKGELCLLALRKNEQTEYDDDVRARLEDVIRLRKPIFGAFVTAISSSTLIATAIRGAPIGGNEFFLQLGLLGAGVVLEGFISGFPGLTYHVWVARLVFRCPKACCCSCITSERLFKSLLEVPEVILFSWNASYFLHSVSDNAGYAINEFILVLLGSVICLAINRRLTHNLLDHDETYRLMAVVVVNLMAFMVSFSNTSRRFGGAAGLLMFGNFAITSTLQSSTTSEVFEMEHPFKEEIGFALQELSKCPPCVMGQKCFHACFNFDEIEVTADDVFGDGENEEDEQAEDGGNAGDEMEL